MGMAGLGPRAGGPRASPPRWGTGPSWLAGVTLRGGDQHGEHHRQLRDDSIRHLGWNQCLGHLGGSGLGPGGVFPGRRQVGEWVVVGVGGTGCVPVSPESGRN